MAAGQALIELFDRKVLHTDSMGILEFVRSVVQDDLNSTSTVVEPRDRRVIKGRNLENRHRRWRSLYQYLVDRGCIEQLEITIGSSHRTFSREGCNKIQSGDRIGSSTCPRVAELIKNSVTSAAVGPRRRTDSHVSPVIAPLVFRRRT